jgi:hypothetical protein
MVNFAQSQKFNASHRPIGIPAGLVAATKKPIESVEYRLTAIC